MTAMLRNLATMTRVGLLARPLSDAARPTASGSRTTRPRLKKKAPEFTHMSILIALKTYASGKGVKGDSEWTPVQAVVDGTLNDAFYLAFGTGQAERQASGCSAWTCPAA